MGCVSGFDGGDCKPLGTDAPLAGSEVDAGSDFDALLMLRARDAGGPTGTMRDPNSTPIVTS